MRDIHSILVVDDDPESLLLLTDVLRAEDYRVRVADSGKLALQSVQDCLPNLILLDIRMPGMDGFEVCRRLKAGMETRDVPVMFLSAAREVEERVQGLALGAVDFIAKPFQREELLARVRTHLDLGRLRTQLEQQVAQRTADLRVAVEQLQREVTERKRAEEALRKSEELTRLGMQVGRTYTFEWNPETDEVHRSYNCAEILGIAGDASSDTQTAFLQRVHPDDRDSFLQKLKGLSPASETCESEHRVIGSGGRIAYLHASIRGLFDESGRLTRSIGVVADITRSKQAEAALRESEQRFKLFMRHLPGAVWMKDLEGNYVYANECCEKLFHTPLNELRGKTDDELFAPEVARQFRENDRVALTSGSDFQTIETLPLKDGLHYAVVSKFPIRNGEGRPVMVGGVAIDITERRKTEAALMESEERFQNMADTAPVMIWVSGPDKLCTFFNKGWLDFTGRPMDRELGDGWVEGVHPDDRERCIATYCSSFDARRAFQLEYRLRRADGEYRLLLDSGVARFAPGGDFAGYIGSCFDITDFRRAQEEAFDRQKLESLRVLTGGIAHDFNNLLGSILADAELAEIYLAEGSSPGEEVERIKAVAIRAAEIVRELMIYSGQESADLGPVDVSCLVEEMLELLKASISKHIAVKIDFQKNLPPVRGNAAQIRQIVMNLILNASEAIGEKGGVIQVSTGRLAGSDDVRLTVSDTGRGMTEQEKARIFDPFFTTKFAGHGLGLALVHGIVSSHGGAINVVTAPGKGATFEVLLPCDGRPVESAAPAAPIVTAREPTAVSCSVLLVEDEDTLRLATSKALRKRGFSVFTAGDGWAAVDVFRAHAKDIDVVLLDLTLPGISGREVFEQIRLIAPAVKVIFTSAYDRESCGSETLGQPVPSAFLRKPYEFAELTRLLQEAVVLRCGTIL